MQDVFIAKLDQQGNFIWAKNYGGPGDDIAFDMKALVEGNHYVTGQFSGTANFDGHILTSAGGTDIFVFLSNLNGTISWVKQAGGIGSDAGRGIDADNLYECFVTGSFSDAVSFDMINANAAGGTDLFTGHIFDPTSGINKTDKADQIIFYPNPVSTTINFTTPIKGGAAYRIFDLQGSLVMEGLIRNQNSSIDVSRLTEGIYFVSIDDRYFKFAVMR